MARLAHQLAQESNQITADVVEITEFPHLARQYEVMSVPKVVIDGSVEFTGAIPEARFVEEVLRASRG
jgi:predicted DsbA family dithiol-disulfide isomerase